MSGQPAVGALHVITVVHALCDLRVDRGGG
jgi:hypothetical protein